MENGYVFKSSLEGPGELSFLAMAGLNAIRASFGQAPVVALGQAPPEVIRDELSVRLHLSHYVAFEPVVPLAGTVTLRARFDISPAGDVTSASLRALPELTVEALEEIKSTIAQWKFQPFVLNGQPAHVTAEVTVVILPDGAVRSSVSPF